MLICVTPANSGCNLHAGYRTQSGHAAFSGSPTKPWESGQRPRSLQPEEMPWARGHSPSRPPKSLSGPDRTISVGIGHDADDLLDGMPRQHQQSSTLTLDAAASDVTAQPSSNHVAASQLFEVCSVLPVPVCLSHGCHVLCALASQGSLKCIVRLTSECANSRYDIF